MHERGGWVDVIYLVLKYTFDKAPHKSPIWKIEYKGGLKETVLKWMKHYLQG